MTTEMFIGCIALILTGALIPFLSVNEIRREIKSDKFLAKKGEGADICREAVYRLSRPFWSYWKGPVAFGLIFVLVGLIPLLPLLFRH